MRKRIQVSEEENTSEEGRENRPEKTLIQVREEEKTGE